MVLSALEKDTAEMGTRKYQGGRQVYSVKKGCQKKVVNQKIKFELR